MAGVFDPGGFEAAAPLDVPSLPGQPQVQPPNDRRKWLQLIPLVAAAAKGGPGALEGLLQGYQQAEQQRQQQATQQAAQQRQSMLDQRLLQNDQFSQGLQLQQAKSRLMGDFTGALKDVENEEAARALVAQYEEAGQPYGFRGGTFERLMMQTVTPTALQQKRIQKRWAGMSAQERQLAQQTGATLTIDGQEVPYQQWSAVIGGMVDPKTGAFPQAPTKENQPTPGSFEEYVNLPPEQQRLREQQRKAFLTSDDRPPAPTGGEKPLTQNQRATIIGSRRTQWQRFSKAVTDRETSIARIDAGLQALQRGNRNAATQAIIIAFNKLQDETSVVREGEYARSEQLVPLIGRIEGGLQRLIVGGASMRDSDLVALANEAKSIATAMKAVTNDAAMNLRQAIEEELGDYAIPTSRVFGGSTIGARQKPAPSVEVGKTYTHPQHGRVRVVGVNPDGTVKVEKVP